MANPKHRLTVPSDPAPKRLDQFLAAQPSLDLTRNRIQQLIESGMILVNGNAVAKNHKLAGGEKIEITIPPPQSTSVQAEAIELRVLYEDEFLAVVDKPAGMVTHPAAGNYSGTLVNALMHRYQSLPGVAAERLGIVHRLDKLTSGLLVVARTESALAKLQQMISSRQVHRQYLALVCGHMKAESGLIELPIGRSMRDRKKMAVTSKASRLAKTEYLLQERFRVFDLLEIKLHTGRTHQIRVHLSHLGHPVFGDPEYGGRDTILKGIFAPERPLVTELLQLLPRQALHAERLSFLHPFTQKEIDLRSEIPADFRNVLTILRKRGS